MASEYIPVLSEELSYGMTSHWLVRIRRPGTYDHRLYDAEVEARRVMRVIAEAGGICYLFELRSAFTGKIAVEELVPDGPLMQTTAADHVDLEHESKHS